MGIIDLLKCLIKGHIWYWNEIKGHGWNRNGKFTALIVRTCKRCGWEKEKFPKEYLGIPKDIQIGIPKT